MYLLIRDYILKNSEKQVQKRHTYGGSTYYNLGDLEVSYFSGSTSNTYYCSFKGNSMNIGDNNKIALIRLLEALKEGYLKGLI